MKIAIVGGRDFYNTILLQDTLINYCKERDLHPRNIAIVSGGASGADTLAEMFADRYNIRKIIFKADWNLYGKQAGFVRNHHIINEADVVFAFWDGKSKGTSHSIELAKKANKKLYIIRY